jgi:hypothetical protein
MHEVRFSTDYLLKVRTLHKSYPEKACFSGVYVIRRKANLSANYTAERHVFFHELFCIKAGFSIIKSAECFYFP